MNTPITLTKLGTLDFFIVEANPVVFRGQPWLMEYIRYMAPDKRYPGNTSGDSYFRFRSLTDCQTVTPPFGAGLHMGCAFVENDHIVVTAVENWGKSRFYQLESDDMIHWTAPRVILEDPLWKGYNTSVCKAGDRYVMVFELGAPKEIVHQPFTMFFAQSTNLHDWTLIPDAVFGREFYTGAPALKFHDGWFYFFYLRGSYSSGYTMAVTRSRDLVNWDISPRCVLGYDEADRNLHPQASLSPELRKLIAGAEDINASDLDFCDYRGKLLASYSWGNQHGTEFLALAEADVTERQFCESFWN